ncbi:protein kinase domain-containing protein [Aquisphaera insulae]|uniref:serine/threonine-protein kinase n=1 Tax=Aquisphaera insulae TaxID=2712864 RepID=UPI0013E9F4F2|nr:serine/threonine-protein kinase [Aquisphaera insulae]
MSDPLVCPRCGVVRPPSDPVGACPACLLRLGLSLGPGIDRDDRRSGGGRKLARGAPDRRAPSARVRRAPGASGTTVGKISRIDLRHGTTGEGPGGENGVATVGPLAPGTARYQLFEELARGGMGVVIRGRDVDLGRDVAVKVLREELAERPEVVSRFVEEAQIGGQLQHPGIIPVYELGRLPDSRLYIAMKLVRGRTLAEMLRGRADPTDDLPRLLATFDQVCQTMAYAHSSGVIHRDLKPSNIMVGNFGEVQVMDWGLAKVLGREGSPDGGRMRPGAEDPPPIRTGRSGFEADASRAGSVLGTAAYMAPEQARGDLESLDERADVFGLGAILCEILTGEPPHTGPAGDDLHERAERGDLSECLGRLDACGAEGGLVAIARSCLSAEPQHRPRDAGVVAARLTAHLAGTQERLRAAELAKARAELRAAEERKRRMLTVGLAASLVAVAALTLGGAAWMARERSRRIDAASRAVVAAAYEASTLLSRARSSPGPDLALWAQVARAVEQAESAAGGPDVRPVLRRQVMELSAAASRDRDRALAEARDLRMVERLARIHADIAVHFRLDRAESEYLAAFRDFGIDIDGEDPAAAGARLAKSPLAIELANALDQWTFLRRHLRGRGPEGAARLVAIAKAVDPDPWRNQLRDTLSETAADRGQAVEALRRLAATADPERLPEASVTRLAWALAVHRNRPLAIDLLSRAQRVHPDNFWLNVDLAGLLAKSGRHDEAIRYYSVAQAISPRSELAMHSLSGALRAAGRTDEADRYPRPISPPGGPPPPPGGPPPPPGD